MAREAWGLPGRVGFDRYRGQSSRRRTRTESHGWSYSYRLGLSGKVLAASIIGYVATANLADLEGSLDLDLTAQTIRAPRHRRVTPSDKGAESFPPRATPRTKPEEVGEIASAPARYRRHKFSRWAVSQAVPLRCPQVKHGLPPPLCLRTNIRIRAEPGSLSLSLRQS